MAAKHPVRLHELQQAAGEYLARQLKCEAAMVTAGAASALTLATAAAMTLGNRTAIHNIPTDVTGLKNEVIAQKAHRYEYDHAIRNCGARFVEVVTLADYEAAFTRTHGHDEFLQRRRAGRDQPRGLDPRRARHGVPCLNDAAADVPPISNLWNYTKWVLTWWRFPAARACEGRRMRGLLLGRKDLIDGRGAE